jgi:hypothetical protein
LFQVKAINDSSIGARLLPPRMKYIIRDMRPDKLSSVSFKGLNMKEIEISLKDLGG